MFCYLNKVILCFTLILLPVKSLCSPIAKVTAKAIDEKGNPIVGGKVRMSFSIPKKDDIGLASINKKGITDIEGKFTESSECYSSMGFSVDKEGYYQSGDGYEFKTTSGILQKKWVPWNPTIEVVLKKKRNPVPMYMNNTNWATIPKLDSPIGYDLKKGDWVAPFGQGLIGDLQVSFSSDYKAYRDYKSTMTITFSNQKDGIQEYIFEKGEQSLYRWPYEAPAEGYLKKIEKFKSDRPGKGIQTNVNKDANYIFRVRTKTDKEGNIIEAKYGKIGGDFQVGRKPQFGIGYYYNPDGTRNLEEDPEKNLFPKKKR